MPLPHTAAADAASAATHSHRKLTLGKQGAHARQGQQPSRISPGLPLLQGLRVLHNGAADLKGKQHRGLDDALAAVDELVKQHSTHGTKCLQAGGLWPKRASSSSFL